MTVDIRISQDFGLGSPQADLHEHELHYVATEFIYVADMSLVCGLLEVMMSGLQQTSEQTLPKCMEIS